MKVQTSKSLALATTIAAVLLALALTSDAHAQTAADTLRASHVLNRLTFGARPGDLEKVLKIGVDNWIAAQLRPEILADKSYPELEGSPNQVLVRPTVVVTTAKGDTTAMMRNELATIMQKVAVFRVGGGVLTPASMNYIRRAASTEKQLAEVLTDFWVNHFSVFRGKTPSPSAIGDMLNTAIRPNAIGKFRDILGAVAESPAMVHYLDNRLSGVDAAHMNVPEYRRFVATGQRPAPKPRAGLNENYARELLELHTMGVDAGYTQNDVIEVARAFTGWTLAGTTAAQASRIPNLARTRAGVAPNFFFGEEMHDAESKTVLGQTLAAGRGKEDGLDVLDILAKHPSTARFIARKLVIRFVADDPPESLIKRAAETFVRTDGDIREVVRTIVTSEEFFAPEVFRSKVRSPQELILAMQRAVSEGPGDGYSAGQMMNELNQTPFGKETPDGWPETGSAWMSSGAMFGRIGIAMRVASGDIPALSPDSSSTWRALADSTFEKQIDAVVNIVLGGRANDDTRAALLGSRSSRKPDGSPADGKQILRELLTIALGSPEFQRR